MANTTTGLFETLVAAASEASQSLKFKNAMLEKIYMQYRPEYAALGQTLNVQIPTVLESDVNDIGAGDIQITDTDHTSTTIVFNKNQSTTFVVRNFDQVRTPTELRELYIDARMEALLRKVNRDVCNLCVIANWASYTEITGGADVFARTSLATAWANLANAGVPVDDTANLHFVTHPTVYSNMLNDTSYNQESIVGINAADKTRTAAFLPQFGANLDYDQQFPQPTTGVFNGLFFHRNAIAMRTAPLPPMADGSLREAYVYPKPNLPVRVQMQNSITKQGMVINMNVAYGLKIVRPDHGSSMKTT